MLHIGTSQAFSFSNNNNINNRKALSIVNTGISSHHHSSPLNKLPSLSSSLIHKSRISSISSSYSSTQLHLWFLKKKEENKDDDDDDKNNDEKKDEPSTKAEAEAEAKVLPQKEETKKKKKKELDPVEYAQELKRQATKARLEADKMDAILTLEKISLLESKLKKAMSVQESENENESISSDNNDGDDKKKKTNNKNKKSKEEEIKEIQTQIDILTKKMNPTKEQKVEEKEEAPKVITTTESFTTTSTTTTTITKEEEETLSPEELQRRIEAFEGTPKFLRQIVAKTAGFKDDSDSKAIVLKMYEVEQEAEKQKSQLMKENKENKEATSPGDMVDAFFDPKQKDPTDREFQEMVDSFDSSPQFLKDLIAGNLGVEDSKNSTAILMAMKKKNEEQEALKQSFMNNNDINNNKKGSGSLFDNDPAQVSSEETQMIESLYPKSTRKEGEGPTMAQMDILYKEVLNDMKVFVPSGKPEPISGGFIVRGSSRIEDGDELISAIDERLEKSLSSLNEKVSIFYMNDPTPVTEEQMMAGARDPVLLVMGADITKPTNRFLSVLVSCFGFGGISFLSIYPFVLNDDIAKRVDEQLTLATSATGGANLDFLSELSSPIFLTFVAIQFAHDAAHLFFSQFSSSNGGGGGGFKASFPPTLVPSPLIGLTSSVTQLKSSPKNKNALLDYALSGPLVGMLTSILSIFIGLEITLGLDKTGYNALPVLPVQFLKQSALAGGMIEGILGQNTLTGIADPVTATMHVHPYVIAGICGLLVNAINLTPFGRTDGGRVSLALFGRSGAQLVGLITLVLLFTLGVFTSDPILFYFSFILFFQSELEIPLRNEVSDVSFPRVLLAIASGVLVLLSILPM